MPRLGIGVTAAAVVAAFCLMAPAAARAAGKPYTMASEIARLTLVESAIERLGIETAVVQEVLVAGTRTLEGIVLSPQSGPAQLALKVLRIGPASDRRPAIGGEALIRIWRAAGPDGADRDGSAPVALRGSFEGSPSALVHPVAMEQDTNEADGGGPVLEPGDRVLVELTGGLAQESQKSIPYSSLIYDETGGEWVFLNPHPGVFYRYPVQVAFIEDDRVVLSNGPPIGAMVVETGAAELFGIEFETGH